MRSIQIQYRYVDILSPAKTMTGTSKIKAPQGTTPRFQQEANEIALNMTQFPIDELSRILKLSPNLAAECYRRYQDFHGKTTSPCKRYSPIPVSYSRISARKTSRRRIFFSRKNICVSYRDATGYFAIRPYQALPDGVRRKNPRTRRREYVHLLEGQANKYINP